MISVCILMLLSLLQRQLLFQELLGLRLILTCLLSLFTLIRLQQLTVVVLRLR